MSKTFRFSRSLTAILCTFGIAGVAGLLVLPLTAPNLLFPTITLAAIYLPMGVIGIMLSGANVQLTDSGIMVRRFTGAPIFRATWNSVEHYEFRPANMYVGHATWVLATTGGECKLPQHLEDYAEMQRLFLLRLPSTTIRAPREHRQRNTTASELRIGHVGFVELAVGTLGWLFMVFGTLTWISLGNHNESWLVLAVYMWFPLLSIGLLGTPAVYNAFRSFRLKELRLDSTRVQYGEREIPWSDLVLFESRLVSSGKGGPSYRVAFVGRLTAFTIDNTQNRIEEIEAFAASHAPPEAFVILARLPALQS